MAFPSLPRIKLVPLAIVALLGYGVTPSFALPVTYGNITLDATYSLGSGPTVNGMDEASIYSTSDGADLYLNTNDTSGNSVFFHTYGSTGSPTYFGARASGEGTFSAATRSTYSNVFTNTSSSAQLFTFSFNVAYGNMGITGTGDALAELLLNIKKDGTSVARDQTTITQNSGGVSCASNDLGVLSSYVDCASPTSANASGSGGLFTVDFGMVGAGESFTLDYDIIATVSGSLSNGTGTHTVCDGGYGFASLTEDGYGGYGGGPSNCHEEPYTFPGYAIAQSGDPFENGFQLASDFTGTFSDVPEPGSLALVGLAVAGLAATRRKKLAPAS